MSETDSPKTLTPEELEARIEEQLGVSYDRRFLEVIRRDPAELLVFAIGAAFFLYHMWYAATFPVAADQHVVVHLGFALCFWAAFELLKTDRSTRRGKLLAGGYLVYFAAVVWPTYYMFTNFQRLLFGAGAYSNEEVFMGGLVILLLLIALWSVSRLIFGVVIVGLLYSYFGAFLPGVLRHSGLPLKRIITMNTVEFNGVYGRLTMVAATWVVIFVMLASLVEKYGGMSQLIKGVTQMTTRHRHVKVGHVAVLASMVFGSINGATTANAATTGAFTIPLMKENGYPPRLAAALEAVASCGGQVLPPVMGTSVFIMAELIDPSYTEIIISATAPALLFFIVVITSIELYISRVGTSENEMPLVETTQSNARRLYGVLSNYEYIGMFAVLMYWLVYVQADPLLSGYYSILTLIGLRLVRVLQTAVRTSETTLDSIRLYARETLEGFRRSAEAAISISVMVAALGIVVRAFIVTGFAQNLSRVLISIAAGSVILMVLVAAIASILFGMGMPTVAAYLLVALFVAPPVAEVVSVDILAIHMFVFYFAIVSNITPPIAVAVVITQGIAGSGFLETSIDALKMGFPLFLLPFLFIFNESLLVPSPMLVATVLLLSIGFLAISVAVIGYRDVSLPVRLGLFIVGFAALFAQQLALQVALVAAILVALSMLNPRVAARLPLR
jgi:TRAP transporter 4TM/12TM fusion protein